MISGRANLRGFTMAEPAQPERLHQERIFLTYPDQPGRRIGVRVELADAPEVPSGGATRPFVVLVHGFKGFIDWGFFPHLSRRWAAAGFVVVSMNTSGSGVGEDPMAMDDEDAFFNDSYSRQLEDMARVRTFARSLPGVDPEREVLFGHSRGGGMAVISAAEEAPAALVTWAAIGDADRFDEAMKARWREDGYLPVPNARTGQVHRMGLAGLEDFEQNVDRFNIAAAASRLQAPLLAIHGLEDGTVAYDAAVMLSERAQRGEALLIEGADHGLGASHPLESPESIQTLEVAVDSTLTFALQHTRRG